MNRNVFTALALLIGPISFVNAQIAGTLDATQPVTIDSGQVTGVIIDGDLKWKPPQPLNPQQGILQYEKC